MSRGVTILPGAPGSGSGGVTSIAGTANQITASAATGAVTLSIPSTFIAPGSIAATSTINGTVITASTQLVGAKMTESTTAGGGITLAAGTAGASALYGIDVSQTLNASGITSAGFKMAITDTSSNASAKVFEILTGASGTTSVMSLTKGGALTTQSNITVNAGSVIVSQSVFSLADGQQGFVLGASQDTNISRKAAGIVAFGTGANGSGVAALFLSERTAPSAPAADGVHIYAQDNGAGKTQLMALFSSGAAQQIAIQP